MFIRYMSLLILMFLVVFPGCTNDKGTIVIDGSTTMYDLNLSWGKAYMEKRPGTTVEVFKSGTKQGIESFLNGKCDIADSSRKLTPEEILKAKEKGVDVGEFYVGFAVYAVAVNPKNPVEKLDEEQVRNIFLGKITNWKDVGGEDKEIKVCYREINSNDYDYFLDKFVNISDNMDMNKLPPNINIFSDPEAIVNEINTNDCAIGYFLIQYQNDKTKPLAVAKKDTGKFVRPTIDESLSGDYPILRPYYMYMSKYADKPLRDYVDFIYSSEGIEIAKKMQFVPVPVKDGDIDRNVLFEYI
jgi:phosphate transport system substrate-binding protein